MFNIMRGLCHPAWKPSQVLLARRKPEDIGPYSSFFQAPLEFDADRYALVFTADWLRRPLSSNDPDLHRRLQQQVDAVQARHPEEFPDQVRSVLRTALLTGHAKADQVAALFAMHGRTFARRLETCGTSFQQLLDESRFEIARQMLEDSGMQIRQIAELLGYADSSAFTRAFGRWSGSTPALWRSARKAAPQVEPR